MRWFKGIYLPVSAIIVLFTLGLAAPTLAAPHGDAAGVLPLLNTARASVGAGALTMNAQLVAAAQGHSSWMAANETLSHTGAGGSSFTDRISAAGYTWTTAAENVLVRGDDSSGGIFGQWQASPPHNANMMNPAYVDVGIACATSAAGNVYCTMDLAAPPGGGSGGFSGSSGGTGSGSAVSSAGGSSSGTLGGSAAMQSTPLPPGTDPLAYWNGNPGSPTYDGRLNPHAAEYYTVYCRDDNIAVFRADGLLLRRIAIATVLTMNPAGSTLDIGDRMTIARSNDSITIGGYNGNAAPAFGSKEFSLRACLSANGRTPAAVPPAQQPGATATPSTPGAVNPANPPAGSCTYVVQAGETAFRIARRYGVTLAQLGQVNPQVNLSRLSVGQRLVIPGCTGTINPPVATATPTVPAPPGNARVHVVQAGENLFRIALRYGRTVAAIAAANGITDVTRIYVGQRLVIP